MDLSVIWDAVTRNLATVSVVSLGGPLWAGVRWVYCRFNKTRRFRMLRDEAVAVTREISFLQQSWQHDNNRDKRASYRVETVDNIVEMVRALQDDLRPLGVHLFSEDEMSTEWLYALDKPLKDGNAFEPLGEERRRETGLAVQSVSRLMRSGEYQKAKREFPPTYDGARLRISAGIKSRRAEITKDYMEAQGIDDNRPVGAPLRTETTPPTP
ncbi:MAG: hypothetical protein OXU69_09535 [Gemmatimonadota bacterium]|nr:hypothetical protein [bacterium]MDE2984934.1 hypothetical protein [Gemmatimonadota bacterium]